jgi:hypothetical protein
MLDILFNGASYGSQFFYDITWFVWAKRITLWAMCGSVMYWIPGVSSLHLFLEEAALGHLMYPYGLDAICKLPIAPFIDLTGMGWPAVYAHTFIGVLHLHWSSNRDDDSYVSIGYCLCS